MTTPKAELVQLALDGLLTDGDHHKQWYLEQILRKLYSDSESVGWLIDQLAHVAWEPGIAP